MITYEITASSLLILLSKTTSKVTMHELFDLIPKDGLPQESAVTFIKTLNQLLEAGSVETYHSGGDSIYWGITEEGRGQVYDYLNP